MADVKVLGIAQAERTFRELADKIRLKITRKAVRAAGKIILEQIKSDTYKGNRERRTGLLGLSPGISVRTRGGLVSALVKMRRVNIRAEAEIAAGVKRKNRKFTSKGKPKHTPYYWLFLEKGTKTRRTRRGADRGQVQKSAYVLPAFTGRQDQALDRFTEIFNSETEREARKLHKGKPR